MAGLALGLIQQREIKKEPYRWNSDAICNLRGYRGGRRKCGGLDILSTIDIDDHGSHNIQTNIGRLKHVQSLGIIRWNPHLGDKAEESDVTSCSQELV